MGSPFEKLDLLIKSLGINPYICDIRCELAPESRINTNIPTFKSTYLLPMSTVYPNGLLRHMSVGAFENRFFNDFDTTYAFQSSLPHITRNEDIIDHLMRNIPMLPIVVSYDSLNKTYIVISGISQVNQLRDFLEGRESYRNLSNEKWNREHATDDEKLFPFFGKPKLRNATVPFLCYGSLSHQQMKAVAKDLPYACASSIPEKIYFRTGPWQMLAALYLPILSAITNCSDKDSMHDILLVLRCFMAIIYTKTHGSQTAFNCLADPMLRHFTENELLTRSNQDAIRTTFLKLLGLKKAAPKAFNPDIFGYGGRARAFLPIEVILTLVLIMSYPSMSQGLHLRNIVALRPYLRAPNGTLSFNRITLNRGLAFVANTHGGRLSVEEALCQAMAQNPNLEELLRQEANTSGWVVMEREHGGGACNALA